MERAEKLERHCYAGVEYEVSAVWFAAVASHNRAVVFQFQG
jgi:hypothetical protein